MDTNRFVPEGFVALASYDNPGRKSRGHNGSHSLEYARLQRAIALNQIRWARFSGRRCRIYVCKLDADKLLKRFAAQERPAPSLEAHWAATSAPAEAQPSPPQPAADAGRRQLEEVVVAISELRSGIADVCQVLDRIAISIETVATEPKPAAFQLNGHAN